MKNPKFAHAFEVVADIPEALAPIKRLATNFRWTWHHETRDLFRVIDKAKWASSSHNPILFLNSVSAERLNQLAKDPSFLARLRELDADLEDYLKRPSWYQSKYPTVSDANPIAYFCFEFGITEGLPIYSGGLGVLAGDHLKAASDLGIPLVGVGLLYNRGYFRQRLSHDGWQQEVYPEYDFYQMPLTMMRDAEGQPLRIEVELPDRNVTCQVWRADVGRIPLYLLDSNVLENAKDDQGITDSLYSGDEEMRIRQEMILGIGGMRALRALGIEPGVCHLNEGHAAFLSLERIRQIMESTKVDFRTARQLVAASNVFTTHTPVPAGFDRFAPDLLRRYVGPNLSAIGVAFDDFVKLGRAEPENSAEPFNMALLAMDMAYRVNGVAQLHGQVSRSMFSFRWPDYPEDEVPIVGITNGVHTLTWVSRRMASLFDNYLGPDWRRRPQDPEVWQGVYDIPDDELWLQREAARADLVRFARKRLVQSNAKVDFGTEGSILDSRVLTIGFARRFATYKRGSLMLADRERLKQILFHTERPVQIVIAGKAHPRDDGGKHIIQDLWRFIHAEGGRARMVFLEDYDMQVARALVQGVDLWLNNPRRPNEASGTSGMKVVPNGGLNVSILDGWWDEAYEPGVGWAIGERALAEDASHQDWLDSRALYSLLENAIAPTFYRRDANGVPTGWTRMVKDSIAKLAWRFSTDRMVAEYTSRFYSEAMDDFHALSENGMAAAKEAVEWHDFVEAKWGKVRVTEVSDDAQVSNPAGKEFMIRAKVDLGDLKPQDVRVQAVIGRVGPNRELYDTRFIQLLPREDGWFSAPTGCFATGHMGYVVRVVPHHEHVSAESDLRLVAWE